MDEDLGEARDLAHDALDVLDGYGDGVGAVTAVEAIVDLAVMLGEPERSSLTPVGRDVVRLVADCHANAEIGQRLFFSLNTVKKGASVVSVGDLSGRITRL